MPTVKISDLTEKATMVGTEEVLINDSGVSKKFSTQRFLDVKTACETSETNAAASAVAAANSAASAASVYDSFDDRYLGNKTSDPALDNDGNALVTGALYFNTTTGNMMVYDGAAWITTSSAILSTLDVYKFTATSGQTIFTGTDDDSNTLAIKPTAEIVVLNGVILEPTTDYTVTTTTLTLTSGATLDDEVNVYAFGNFELADHYSKSASDARYYTQTQIDTSLAGKSDTSHNHSGVYEPADATIVKDADIGVTVQAYDVDTAKTDVAQTFTATQSFGDNVKAQFGAGNDLEIFHSGSDSFVRDKGTGDLYIQGEDQIRFTTNLGTETYAIFNQNGACTFNYDNATKLATTSNGVDVTGSVTTTGVANIGGTTFAAGTLRVEDSSANHIWMKGRAADGSSSVSFRNNADTAYNGRIAADDSNGMTLQVAGSERMRIDSSGNVGIGTSSPDKKLHVKSSAAVAKLESTATTGSCYTLYTNATADLGYIGFGSGASDTLHVMNYKNAALDFGVNSATKMRLETDGDLHADGDVIAYSTTISDERLKEDIKPIENALDKVSQLNGYTFTYTADGKESAGLIAQDVEKVLPSAVSEKELPLKMDDGIAYKTVQYDQTIGLLVEAVKELTARVEELEAK